MEITPYVKNAKKHPDKQLKLIAESIRQFGWQQPIKVGQDNIIIVGHGRWEAYQKYGDGLKPAWIVDKEGKTISGEAETRQLTPAEEKAYRLADNKINESDWEMDKVIDELKELDDEGFDIGVTGFDYDLLIDPEDKDDEVPETPEEPKSKLGDIYELGRHRVLCGDSTKVEDLAKLMDGRMADMVFTDPPYNVGYEGSGKNTSNTIMNDEMSDEAFDEFLVQAFHRIAENIKRTAGCYIFHSHKTASDFDKALKETGFIIDTQLIWNKPSAGMGMNDYRTKHEPFYYAYLSKEEKNFYGDRTGTTVWKIPEEDDKALKWFKRIQESLEQGSSTVWTMKRANVAEYVHPTQKPVELPATAMTKSSKQDDIVLDTFLGSGTTLISAEKTGRICYGMELDSKYVDVIIQRYVNYTGNTEVKKNGKVEKWYITTQND